MIAYNEIDPFACQWMRNAMDAGLIARGEVHETDIRHLGEAVGEVLDLPAQFHAFAGIGIWSHALRMAGWPDDVPAWTGSCPCQPFSQAGRRKGFDDERHLWPAWFDLIRRCRPPIVFGEQVASPDGLRWLDSVFADLEGAGYTCEAFDLCAASVGAPHIRQRLYFVAFADVQRCQGLGVQLRERGSLAPVPQARGRREARELGDASRARSGRHAGTVPRAKEEGEGERISARDLTHFPESTKSARGVAHANISNPFDAREPRSRRLVQLETHATAGFWSSADWILCRDEKYRPVEPGTFPLAHGAQSRVGRLRAHGNQIVPQVAATFIASVMDWLVEIAAESTAAE